MKSLFVAAGHNANAPGACANGYQEATLALKMRDRIKSYLTIAGIDCVTDGDVGVNLNLTTSIALCKQHDIAVEIHFNAAAPTAHGVEALCKPHLKVLAQDLCGAVYRTTGIIMRGDFGWKATDSGQHARLGFCEANGIILEVCFITNKDDIKRYVENKEATALAIAKVLQDYARR